MKKRNSAVVIFLATMLCLSLLSGCGTKKEEAAEESSAVPETIVVTDMIGRSVEVTPGTYTNIVCIGAGALRLYSYVGDVKLLCGVEDIDNPSLEERPKMFDRVARPYIMAYGDEFSVLPSCGVGGPQAQTAEAEKILSCLPDLVISEYEDAEKEDALEEQLGVPVITMSTGSKGIFDETFYDSLSLLGMVLGKETRAQEVIDFVRSESEEISKRTADIPESEKPSVYICGLGNWGTTNHLMTSENYISFEIANVKNAVSGLLSKGVQEIEEEKFVALGDSIDIMFIDAAAIKNITPLYAEDPSMFDTVKAWKNNEVYLQMAFNAYYTNFEIALANTWFIAKTVYPEQFKDIDMTEKTNEITQKMLGENLAEDIFQMPQSYGGYGKVTAEMLK